MSPPASSSVRARITGGDALELIELINMCLACKGKENFRALFPKIQELFPFDFAIAVLGYDRHPGTFSASHVNVSFPEGWLSEYLAKNYLQEDRVVLENFQSFRVQVWPLARKNRFRREEITSLGIDFGLRECCTHGTPGVAGSRGSMFCFSGSSISCTDRHKAILEVLVPHLHMVLSDITRGKQQRGRSVVLSAREKDVLDWLQAGKTSWEISAILEVSERTVNFHVANILRKLQVVNRAQAVAVAIHSGLVDIS